MSLELFKILLSEHLLIVFVCLYEYHTLKLIHNEYNLDETVEATGAKIARSDNQYMWAATLFKGLGLSKPASSWQMLDDGRQIRCRKGSGDFFNLERTT